MRTIYELFNGDGTRRVVVQTSEATQGRVTLAAPDAPLGAHGPVVRYAIDGVPSTVSAAEVLRAFDRVSPMRHMERNAVAGFGPWDGMPDIRPHEERWSYRYDELRPGAILR